MNFYPGNVLAQKLADKVAIVTGASKGIGGRSVCANSGEMLFITGGYWY